MSARRTAAAIFVALASFGGAVAVQATREDLYPPPTAAEQTLYITSPAVLRHLAVSNQALAADLYWIRSIQYYGKARQQLNDAAALGLLPPTALIASENDYDLLYPLLDLTTSLDPRFNIAYRFGATFLADPYPDGAGRPDLAIRLLEKGLQVQPDKWEYMQDIGFVHYWWRHDYAMAATWFNRAADVKDAPWWMRSLAATTLAKGGDRQSSRRMWEAIRASGETEWLQRDSERRLRQLDTLDQIDRLQAIVDRYTARTGTAPSSWDALRQAGDLPGVPVDPTGAPYELHDGRVRLSAASSLRPLPEEPAAQPRPDR